MAGRDFSSELFDSTPREGRDLSSELFKSEAKPTPPSTERTWGEAIKDVPASLLTGAGSLLQAPGQLIKLVPGLKAAGEALEAPGEAVQKFGTDLKSAGLKAREALRSQAISDAEKEGILSEFATAITSTLKDPALITSFITEQVPLLLGPLGAARLTTKLGMGAVEGAAAGAAREAAATKLGQRATTAAIGTGTAMQAADVSGDTYTNTLQRAREMGMSEQEAQDAALNAARIAAGGAAAVSLGANVGLAKLGGAAIERRLAGLPGQGRITSGVGEATSETLEEAGGQVFQNIGLRTVDPNQSLTAGVGSAAAMGALGGGFFGTMLGKKPETELAPGQRPGESLYDAAARINREIQTLNDLAKATETDQTRTQAGLMTNTQLVDMYREQGYGAVKQYQQQLVDQAKDPNLPPEQKTAARDAAQQIQDLFKQVSTEEVSRQMPTEISYKITDTDLTKFGIKGSDPIYKAALGKDVSDPVQVQEIQDAIEAEVNRKGIRQTQSARILFFKDALDRVLETLPAGGLNVTPIVESTSGTSAGLAGVPGVGAAAAGVAGAKPTGVVRPTEVVGQPPARKAAKPAPVKKVVSEEAPIEEAAAPAVQAPTAEKPAAPPAPAPAPAVTPSVSYLPKELAGAKPRYAYGNKQFQLSFGSDIDKALYITAQKTPSRRDADYRAWLTKQGFTPEQITQGGQQVREAIKGIAKVAEPSAGPIALPEQVKKPTVKRSLRAGEPLTEQDVEGMGIRRTAPAFKRIVGKMVEEARPELEKHRALPDRYVSAETKRNISKALGEEVVEEEKPKAEEAKEAPKEKTQKEFLLERKAELVKELDGILKKILAKYNLTGVTLDLDEGMADEGSYSGQIIKLALNLENPVRVLRHESIHALKGMGFFSDAQWKTLVKKAQDEWVDKYLKNREHSATQSRYDAYVELLTKEGKTPTEVQEAIIEEAIADAFGDFDVNGAPAGLMAAIHRRMQNLFKAIKEAFGQAGIDTAEEIFGKIEKGSLKPAIPMGKEQAPKMSLSPKGIPQNIWNLHEKALQADLESAGEVTSRGLTPGGMKRNATMAFRRLNKAVLEFVGDDEQQSLALMRKMNAISGIRDAIESEDDSALKLYSVTNPEEYAQEVPGAEKKSLRGVPLSTRSIMESNPLFAMNELGLKTEGEKKPGGIFLFNDVRSIANALNRDTVNNYGTIDKEDTSANARNLIAKAIADEVAYQVGTTSQTGTGLGWYSNNYPKAVRKLAKKYPELGTNEHARSVFSALVAITSNGEKVSLNIKNAINLYDKLRSGEPMIAPGSRRATALDNNLQMVQDLLEKHGTNFKNVLLQEILVKDMNAALRAMGEKPSGDYLANTKVPAAAVYFGPKLGAFYANLEGAEGYLTMDMWWTRSINRMRGLLMPQATESSINKFREAAGNPNMTRDEVIASTIPLRDRYEELAWTTDLEYTVGEKEPSTKEDKPGWTARAKRKAGAAYEQLKLEHDVMKMANTIYKNEYEMLQEAPFGANDREFMYRAVREAQKMLKQDGVDLTLADIQAALWYYEKRLYQHLSGRKADDIGYDEAISAVAGESDRPARPSVVFDQQPDRGADTGAGVKDIDGVRREPEEAPREKLSLRSQTPEFKFWFGQSKIVDKDGKPKVMYHGTGKDYTIIGTGRRQAKAIFVTEDPEFAQKFAIDTYNRAAVEAAKGVGMSDEAYQRGVNKAIAAVKKDFKNLPEGKAMIEGIRKGYDQANPEAQEYMRNAFRDELPAGPNILPIFVKAEFPFDYDNKDHVDQVVNLLNKDFDSYGRKLGDKEAGDLRRGDWETIEKDRIQKAIIDLGFDGFYVKEQGRKSLAVYSPNQITSATGNVGAYGQRPITAEEAERFGMTEEEAAEAQQRGDIRFSLRAKPFDPADLPEKNKDYILPQDTILYHGAYKSVADAIESVNYLMSRPTMKAHGGTRDEGGLVWFGSEKTAQNYADSKADPMKVKFDREEGIIREPGQVFQAITDKPYRLISRKKVLSESEAEDLNEALGLPDYKSLDAGDSADTAASRAYDYQRSNIDRYKIAIGQSEQEMAAPWPVILKTLKADGFYSNDTVALTAENGIRLSEDGKPMERFSLRSTLPASAINAMDKIAPPRYKPGFAERIMNAVTGDTFTSIRQKLVNRYERLAEYDRRAAKLLKQMGGAQQLASSRAETAALMSDLGAGVLEAAMGVHDRVGGAPIFRNGVTTVSNYGGTVKGLLEIFKPIAAMKDADAFRLYQTWAAVKRGKRLDVEGREELITPAQIRAIDDLRRSNPDLIKTFEKVQKDWLAYNNALVKYQVDTGVLTPEMAREWTKHGDYFPFYRLMDGEDIAGPKTFSSIGNVSIGKKLKGGEDPLGDFFENIVRNSQAAIQAGMKNVAAQAATKQALLLNEVTRLNRKPQSSEPVYRVYENGREVYYRSHDPLFIEAIKALNMADIPFMGLLAKPAAMLRNLVTKDPAFMLANMMRDSLSAWATTGIKMTPVIDTLSNFGKAIAGKSPELDALYSAGVLGGYDYARGSKQAAEVFETTLRRRSGKMTAFEVGTKPFTSVWEALEKGTQASDAATRMEVYKKTLAATGNELEALSAALEVMNFNRKGNSAVIRILTAAVPFLNARIQGLDVLYRTAIMPFGGNATDQAKQRMKTFWVRGMTIMALSSMYWLLTHDDDEYKKQEQETRDNYWLIPSLGVKIPIPFEVGVMFKVIPERIMQLSFGTDTAKDFTDSMKRQLVGTFAFNPIPQVILPLYEVKTNYSFFTDRPIIGKGLENVVDKYQVGPSTSRVAQMIGDSVGFSPMKTDYLIKGYFGTIGSYASDLFDMMYDMTSDSPKASKRFEQLPVVKRFAVDPEARGTVTAYYKLKDEVDQAVRTSNLLERSNNFTEGTKYTLENLRLLATDDYVKDIEKDMKDYREMKQQITASSLSADTKRDLLLSINRMESLTTRNIQNIKKFAQ